jgi:hypothetical protein
MGVSIKLEGSTASRPLSACTALATLKGAGHDLISVATSAVVGKNMPDGPLGDRREGHDAKATELGRCSAGEDVVTYNVDGAA